MSDPRSVTVLAHGLGGSQYLPVPLTGVLIGGAWALTISFAIIALAWRTPRYGRVDAGRPLPNRLAAVVDSSVTRGLVAGLALTLTAWLIMAALFGPDADENPLPAAFYVLLWVGLVVLSLLVGPAWRLLSPIRTVVRLTGGGHRFTGFRRYPDAWGHRPAVVGLFAFVWLELASPAPSSVPAIRAWLLCYLIVTVLGTVICGETWLDRADPFGVYSLVTSRLSMFRRDVRTGRLVVTSPLNNLPSLPVRPGTVALLAVLLGSTAYDSFSAFPSWKRFVAELTSGLTDMAHTAAACAVSTAGLLVFVLVVAVTFWSAARAVGGVSSATRRRLPGAMAHSLIPIVIGYVLAHYLQYLVERGQEAVFALGDPLDRGWNVLWLSDTHPEFVMSEHPTVTVTLKVVCVVGGHIVGVAAAHDAALRLLPRGRQLTGQLTMMVTMVMYTFMGLYLLFGG
ncbi:hypothetical protein [Williamsia sterculiae]|uniref:Fenitrothion hydrolase n=1 Tax=Williamsia sterculiae TaxID=1344003 RepID=A0A1N7FH12_9NOCA|nr:hypothetical protein [Williamsia sterculiae]SIR99577.1 hypothetical protein SAMN05445060_2060 [Williamsia sterculiae]